MPGAFYARNLGYGSPRATSSAPGIPSLQSFMAMSGGGAPAVGPGVTSMPRLAGDQQLGGGQGVPVPTTVPPIVNTAQTNPNLNQAWEQYQARLAQLQAAAGQTDPNLQAQVDRLNQRMSADNTALQKNKALSDLGAQGAALKEAALSRASIGGQSPTGALGNIDAAIQRQGAAAAQGIDIGQQNRLDALTLGGQGIMSAPGQQAFAQQQALNAFLSGGANQAQGMASNLLAQQGLGLNQWQAQQNVALQQQQLAQGGQQNAISNWLRMLQLAGYTP